MIRQMQYIAEPSGTYPLFVRRDPDTQRCDASDFTDTGRHLGAPLLHGV